MFGPAVNFRGGNAKPVGQTDDPSMVAIPEAGEAIPTYGPRNCTRGPMFDCPPRRILRGASVTD